MTHKYTTGFESWWQLFIHTSQSPKGAKYEAYEVWKKMKLEPYTEEICRGVITHKNNDKYFKSKQMFVSPWKHGCRWLSNRCWTQETESKLAPIRQDSRRRCGCGRYALDGQDKCGICQFERTE